MLAYGQPTEGGGLEASAIVVMIDGVDVKKALSVLSKQVSVLLACE